MKGEVAAAIDELLGPMREPRAALEGERGNTRVMEIFRAHSVKANALAEDLPSAEAVSGCTLELTVNVRMLKFGHGDESNTLSGPSFRGH